MINEKYEDLVNNISNKQYAQANQSFKSIMSEKIVERLDQAKIDIASKIFGENVEAADDIQELSKKTLGSYVKKASQNAGDRAYDMANKKRDADEIDRFTNRHMKDSHGERERMKKNMGADVDDERKARKGFNKRIRGIDKATDKLTA